MITKQSPAGEKLTKQSEGFNPTPYQDSGGVWTDGWGNTHGVIPHGPPKTLAQCQADYNRNVTNAEKAVLGLVSVPLTQGQFDALVDFVFNLGSARFESSTLLRILNQGDYIGAGGQFARWVYDNGKVLPGLQTRAKGRYSLWVSK